MGKGNRLTRRVFLLAASGSVGAALQARAVDAAAERLQASEPTARALQYTQNAAEVDAATRGGATRRCEVCRFYGAPQSAWGPCRLFPGRSVKATGWCTGWAALG